MFIRIVSFLVLIVVSQQSYAIRFSQQEDVKIYFQYLIQEHKFSEKQLTAWFDQIHYQESIIKALYRPAEKTKSFISYKPMFVSADTVKKGSAFWLENKAAFERAEKVYGIPAEIILSIIAIESRFGKNQGGYRVIDALATIGFFDPKREKYFKKELTEFLIFVRDEGINPFDIKGSYAGAMGYSQFMPSSIRAYAVDFDDDGKVDIWNNPVDAIGSVANYFRKHRWQEGRPVTIKAEVSGDKFESILTRKLKLNTTVVETESVGWKPVSAMLPDEPVFPFKIETSSGMEYWYGLKNFYVITRYNHSLMYAVTVHHLSQVFESSLPK